VLKCPFPAPILFLRSTIFREHSSLLIVNFFAHGFGFSAAWTMFAAAEKAMQVAIRLGTIVFTVASVSIERSYGTSTREHFMSSFGSLDCAISLIVGAERMLLVGGSGETRGGFGRDRSGNSRSGAAEVYLIHQKRNVTAIHPPAGSYDQAVVSRGRGDQNSL
jgi:hypothetical protein